MSLIIFRRTDSPPACTRNKSSWPRNVLDFSLTHAQTLVWMDLTDLSIFRGCAGRSWTSRVAFLILRRGTRHGYAAAKEQQQCARRAVWPTHDDAVPTRQCAQT